MKFTNFSQEEIHPFLFESTISDLKSGISELSPPQLTTCVSFLQTQDHFDSIQRLIAIIQTTTEPIRFESIGKGMGLKQFLEVLTAFSEHSLTIEKLSPILVGLAPLIFQQALHKIDQKQLALLKQESVTEPLQHHLTLFTHAFEKLYQDLDAFISELYTKINALNHEDLTSNVLNQLENRILELRKSSNEHLNAINKALGITWTTNRLDLIKNLNQLKEHFTHQLHYQIGSPATPEHSATGLFETMDEFLKGVFSASSTSTLSGESIDDEDAAIDGLAKFSIWYLQDYWAMGLLPTISDQAKLELDPENHEEKERIEYRQYLLGLVQWNLVRLNLNKVSDLKNLKIYSKHILKEYISNNQHLLAED